MTANKAGRISTADIEVIKECIALDIPYAEIAQRIGKTEAAVQKFAEKNGLRVTKSRKTAMEAQYDLKSRPYWQELKKQFSAAELELLLYDWGRIIGQFHGDVYPTEETQILDVIKLDILMNRNLVQQNTAAEDINELEAQIAEERKKPRELMPDNGGYDEFKIQMLQQTVGFNRQASAAFSRAYKECLDNKNKLLALMKATRDQRLKRVADSKESFKGWMQQLIDDADLRLKLGTDMEKMRIAADEEARRLGAYHKYLDGTVDQPFLSADTILEDTQ